MDCEKALGRNEDVLGFAQAQDNDADDGGGRGVGTASLSSSGAFVTTAARAATVAEKQIIKTHNSNVDDEKNINSKSSLRQSLLKELEQQLQQQRQQPTNSSSSPPAGEAQKKSGAATATDNVTTNSAKERPRAKSTADGVVKAATTDEESFRGGQSQSLEIVAPARESGAATTEMQDCGERAKAPTVSVELSKRSVGGDKSSSANAHDNALGGDDESARASSEDKVVITTTTTGVKCRYAKCSLFN